MAETKFQNFKQLDLALNWCLDTKTDADLIARLKQCSVSIGPGVFMRFLAWGVGYEQGPINLPEGETPVKDDGLPPDMGDTTIKQEFRRITTLLPTGTAKNVAQWRREEIWIEICSGVQTGERKLLDIVKDQKLLEEYPRLKVLENFLTGWKAPEVKKKTTRKKSVKKSGE